jgi:hypothetical protein
MAKKDRLARRAEKKAAQEIKMPTQADVDAQKQKSLAEGAYTINPDTGKPVVPATPAVEPMQRVESTNFESSDWWYQLGKPLGKVSGLKFTTSAEDVATGKPLITATEEEQVAWGKKYPEKNKKEWSESPYPSFAATGGPESETKGVKTLAENLPTYGGYITNKYGREGALSDIEGNFIDKYWYGSRKFSDEQIDAQIKIDAQKIADADAKIEADAAIAKMGAGGDSQIVKAINQTEEQLKTANSSVADETMKESLGLNSPISPAIAAAVEKSETTGAPIEVTTEDIRKVNEAIDSEDYYSMSPEEQRQLEAYSKLLNDPKTKIRKSEPAIEKLGVQDYYPDMNQGIQEGSYSGSIVGSIPIYTAKGGVLPIGVFDARKRAVEAEAVKAKKTKEDLIELAKVKTAPQYQQAADNLAFGILDKYLNMANGDASVLMDPTNPIGMRVQKELNKVNNIKQEADWLEKRGQELLKAINDEKMYVPNESKEVLKQWLGGNYSMEELMNNKKALKDFHNIYNTLKINDNETYVIGQHFLKWKQDIAPIVADFNASIEALPADKYNELVAIKARGNNDMFMQAALKYMPTTRLAVLAKNLYSTGEFTMGETAFNTYLGSWFNNEIITKLDIRDSGRLQERKFQYQKEKDQQDKIFENLKINTLNVDNQNAILKAAQSSTKPGDNTFLFNTIKKLNGWGDVRENNNGVLVQTIDTKPMQGKESFTTFADADKILIGGKWQTPQEVKNKYKSYSKYLVDDVVDGKVVGKELSPYLMQLDGVAVPKTKEEINLIKYGSATGWSDNMQFDTKVEKGNTYRAYPDPETGKLIPMTAEDYKDEIKLANSRPMVTIYESSGKKTESGFAPTFTSVKVVDLTNTTSTAGLDAFYIKENVPYSAAFDITDKGTPSDDDAVGGDAGNSAAADPVINFLNDPVVEEQQE